MTVDEFGSLMKELNIVYGNKKFPLSKDILDIWNKYLGKYEYRYVEEAVDEFVQESPYTPTIADILGLVKDHQRERLKTMKECREMVEFTMDLYPGSKNSSKIMELTGNLTGWNKPKVAKLCARIRIFLKDSETSLKEEGTIMIPTLDSLLEGWSNESGS